MGKLASIFTGSDSTQTAGQQAAAQQQAAAKAASAAAAFRPVGMTTRFGTSKFTRETDPATGMPYVSSASYTAAPELAALQNQLFGQFGAGAQYGQQQAGQLAPLSPAAQQLFGLGSQYLATSPEQARADYMATQQAALAPGREQQLASIRNQLFQTGRAGLATGGTTAGGMAQTNPELAAYYNSIAQQNLGLASQAEQAAQQRQAFGAGLFGTGATLLGTQAQGMSQAYSPLQTILGLSGTTEQLSQQPYQLGLQLGAAQQPGQSAGAQMYQSGMNQAAMTQYGATQAANAQNAAFFGGLMQAGGLAAGGGAFKGLGGSLSGMFGGGAGAYGATGMSPAALAEIGLV